MPTVDATQRSEALQRKSSTLPATTADLPESHRSPLRYPGGKSRAVKTLMSYVPEGTTTLASPFLGGGSFELACAARGMQVYGADAFEPLVNFWVQAKGRPDLVADHALAHHPLARSDFYALQSSYGEISDPAKRAAAFFVLNRSSFSGTTFSGGMSPGHPRFTESAIERLRAFRARNLNVECEDFRDFIPTHSDTLMYLDPPYANGERLYGDRGDMHDSFPHEELAALLNERSGWILSYNDTPYVRHLYARHEQINPEWVYGMSNDKHSRELLIVSL